MSKPLSLQFSTRLLRSVLPLACSALCLLAASAAPGASAKAEAGASKAASGSASSAAAPKRPAPVKPFVENEAANRELFAALDLSLPELAGVQSAVQRGDWKAARHALGEYLRARKTLTWYWKNGELPKAKVRQEVADNAVKGKVTGGLVKLWHTFPGGKIDWYYNATNDHPPFNPEWQLQLDRMSFWRDMAGAYRNSRDERYPKVWVKQLHSFLEQCPAPEVVYNRHGSSWRTIEAGIRMSGSWPEAFHSFLHSPSVSDDDLCAYMYGTLEHARYLSRFHTRANWLTMEMNGLYTAGVVFPEFKEAAKWRKQAIDTLASEILKQFLPDGAQFELSPGYHITALNSMLAPLKLARAVHRKGELPQNYAKATEKAFAYLMKIMMPNRFAPSLNDSWRPNVRSYMMRARNMFPKNRAFRWFATDGKYGEPPKAASYNLDWAGFLVMRSGWETDANYLLFDIGPLGLAHAHQDKLNVIFQPYGREVLFDSTGGSYEHSKWRDYAKDTFSHNTVLVDGLPQRRDKDNSKANVSKAPIKDGWQSTPQADFGYGVYDEGYGEIGHRIATHTRRVLFAKPDLVVIADTLEPVDNAEHSYQARWHLLTTHTRLDPKTGIVTTTDTGEPNLGIVPLLPQGLKVATASAQTEPELLGWNIVKDKLSIHIPATTATHTRHGKGVQQFVTLLVPQRAGETRAVQSVSAPAPGTFLVEFTDGSRCQITVDSAPTGPITLKRESR